MTGSFRRSPMDVSSTNVGGGPAMGLLLIGAIAACSSTAAPTASADPSAASPTAAPTVSADPSAASPTASAAVSPSAFESARHGYRVNVPPGWVVNEYPGAWDDLEQFTPGGEIPGEDAIAPDGFRSFLIMNSMPIPADMTPAEWHAEFDTIVAAGLPADCSTTTRSGRFAGEPATIVEQTCADVLVVGRSLVHAGRGYYFTTVSPHPDPASAEVVEDVASSVEFTR